MQEGTNSELDVATMVMLLDYGMDLEGYRRVLQARNKDR